MPGYKKLQTIFFPDTLGRIAFFLLSSLALIILVIGCMVSGITQNLKVEVNASTFWWSYIVFSALYIAYARARVRHWNGKKTAWTTAIVLLLLLNASTLTVHFDRQKLLRTTYAEKIQDMNGLLFYCISAKASQQNPNQKSSANDVCNYSLPRNVMSSLIAIMLIPHLILLFRKGTYKNMTLEYYGSYFGLIREKRKLKKQAKIQNLKIEIEELKKQTSTRE